MLFRSLSLDTQVANALHGVYTQPLGRVAEIGSDILGPVLPYVLGMKSYQTRCENCRSLSPGMPPR